MYIAEDWSGLTPRILNIYTNGRFHELQSVLGTSFPEVITNNMIKGGHCSTLGLVAIWNASPISIQVQIPPSLLLILLPDNAPAKAADALSTWVSAIHTGDQNATSAQPRPAYYSRLGTQPTDGSFFSVALSFKSTHSLKKKRWCSLFQVNVKCQFYKPRKKNICQRPIKLFQVENITRGRK